MSSNLGYYYKILNQLEQWQPGERITRLRNMALLILGLHMGGSVHLSLIVRSWPIAGKLPSLVNRLRRFINNERLEVKGWYHPIAEHLVKCFAGKQVRLVIDCIEEDGFTQNGRLKPHDAPYSRRGIEPFRPGPFQPLMCKKRILPQYASVDTPFFSAVSDGTTKA